MKPCEPGLVKFFIGILYHESQSLESAVRFIEDLFAKIDYKSSEFEFSLTDYYREELGWPIFRKFVSLTKLIDPGTLPALKISTNKVEDNLRKNGKRTVNLDPGYMDYAKVVLASAKYNGQKIYLAQGIYADPTLWYEKGTYKPYPFSFPDFKSNIYNETFLHIRALYKGQARKLNRSRNARKQNG